MKGKRYMLVQIDVSTNDDGEVFFSASKPDLNEAAKAMGVEIAMFMDKDFDVNVMEPEFRDAFGSFAQSMKKALKEVFGI